MLDQQFLAQTMHIFSAAAASDDGQRCAVSMAPEAREKLKKTLSQAQGLKGFPSALMMRASEPTLVGLNDGVIIPPSDFPMDAAPSIIRFAAAERAPLRGQVRVVVVLVDFSDKQMTQTKQHFSDLFFGQGGSKKSVREYFAEVTNGLIDLTGEVVGPFRLPKKLSEYANGASGMGGASPNAQTMAYDAAVAANPTVNFTPYDNDGNGFVDAFIVIHAGTGAETNSNPNDIWSHKWVLAGGALTVDSTKIYAYLTVPEDCRIGVCAHELGHLLFGFPDLYDTDNSSEGIGNWCLMAAGSWGGGGDAPCHPSAWCKANQGWVAVEARTSNGVVQIEDVKTGHKVYRLWKDGAAGKEYFLVENRQKTGDFDKSLPAGGLLIWHVDENQTTNRDENHYWVALMQADGKRDMENNGNRGDAGDCWPGSSNNSNFTNTSTPNSKSYAGQATCVAVTGISAAASVMSANLQVKCSVKRPKEFVKEKEFTKEIRTDTWPRKRLIPEKRLDAEKRPDKTWVEIPGGKLTEGRPWTPGGGQRVDQGAMIQQLLARISALEEALGGDASDQGDMAEPFIGSEARPDLSQGAYQDEEDQNDLQNLMNAGAPGAKRLFDTGGA